MSTNSISTIMIPDAAPHGDLLVHTVVREDGRVLRACEDAGLAENPSTRMRFMEIGHVPSALESAVDTLRTRGEKATYVAGAIAHAVTVLQHLTEKPAPLSDGRVSTTGAILSQPTRAAACESIIELSASSEVLVELTDPKRLRDVPEHLAPGLQRYIDHGTRPGGFLSAVLRNDLVSAVSHADETSLRSLYAIVASLLSENTPSSAWGSEVKVEAWIAQGGREGHDVDIEDIEA